MEDAKTLALVYLAHLILPFVAIAWLGFAPAEGQRIRALQMLGVILFVVGFWLSGAWFYPPNDVKWLHALLLAVAVWRAAVMPWGISSASSLWSTAALAFLIGGLGVFAIGQGLIGRVTPDRTVDLDAPLEDGRFCVLSGGATPLLNLHMLRWPEANAERGDSFGADFIAVDDDGLRADGLSPRPSDLEDYYIFGAPIVAPCSGRVVEAFDEIADSGINGRRSAIAEGNHVILACDGYRVLLAHMQAGSIRVRRGERVESGELLGRVGNSGFTSEPHLHIHVQRAPRRGDPPQSGDPVHMTFDGRFLARGDCLG
jgi:hypothetical protein